MTEVIGEGVQAVEEVPQAPQEVPVEPTPAPVNDVPPSAVETATESTTESTAESAAETKTESVPVVPVLHPRAHHGTPESRVKARAATQTKIQNRLDLVMKFLEEKGPGGKIRNDDVEKLLGVSDNTAMRYLGRLTKEGKLKRIGRTGKYTHYTRV